MNATRRWTLYPAGREHEPPYGTVAAAASAGAAVERFKTGLARQRGSVGCRPLPAGTGRPALSSGHLTREPMDTDAGAGVRHRRRARVRRAGTRRMPAGDPPRSRTRRSGATRRAPTAAAPSKGRTPRDAPPAAAPTAARAAARASRTRVSTARRQRPTATKRHPDGIDPE